MCETPNDAPVETIFITDQAHPLTASPGLAGSWTGRLSNSLVGTSSVHPIRRLDIIDGEKPVVAPTYKQSKSKKTAMPGYVERTITWTDDDDSDAKFAFYQSFQCNPNVKFWYGSGPHLYGDMNGIDGIMETSYGIVPGSDLAHRWTNTLRYTSKCDEPRGVLAI